jgi:hypothetical protein
MSDSARQFGGPASYPPPSLVALDARRMEQHDRADAAAEAASVEAEIAASTIRSKAEKDTRIDAATEPYETMEPPEAAELAIEVDNLPPMRARLVRFAAWVSGLQKRLSDLEQGRGAFLKSIGVPTLTEKAIDDLIAKDKTRFLQWLQEGARLAKPVARAFEREQLQEKLKADTHECEVARSALAQAEDEIEVLHRQIATLEKRRAKFVNAALIEHANTVGAEYVAAIAVLTDKLASLLGLASVAGWAGGVEGDERFYRTFATDVSFEAVALPRFGLSTVPGSFDATNHVWSGTGRPAIEVPRDRVRESAKPWKQLADLWTKDARAEPSV